MSTDVELERHALSSLMKSPHDVFAAASAGLVPAHFIAHDNRLMYHAILAAAPKGDTGVQGVWLAMGNDPAVLPALMEVDGLQATSAHRTDLVQRLIDAGRRRKLVAALASATEACKTATSSAFADLWESVAPHIQAAQETTASPGMRTLADMASSLIEQVEKPDTRRTIATPWASWDANATPLRAGELITVAGRPGTGKTAIAVQLADAAQRSGNVAVFSLEMSGEELVGRMAKQRLGTGEADVAAYVRAIRQVGDSKRMHVFDTGMSHAIYTIDSRSRLMASIPGGLALIVIDYLQLVDPTDRRAPREQQVAEMTRKLKQLAGSLQVPVVLLAQLNRESEKEERRPRLSDLRESGAIEQDSDRVWFLWRDMRNVPAGAEEGDRIEVQLIQGKCRGGPPNVMKRFMFNRPAFRFDPIQF
jgi:replicative DNA helicase